MGKENENLALEMLKELKANARRWFIVSVVLAIALLGTNIAWLIHEEQYETVAQDEATQTIEDINNSENSEYTQTIK